MLLLATAEPPASAAALPDQTGSTYQRASVNGLSKRGPALVLERELEVTLDELDLMLEEDTELEVDLTLEDTTELITEDDELVRTLEEETGTIDELLLLEEVTTLELERGQLAPPTTP